MSLAWSAGSGQSGSSFTGSGSILNTTDIGLEDIDRVIRWETRLIDLDEKLGVRFRSQRPIAH